MIPFSGWYGFQHYESSKPNPLGLKFLFCLLEIYLYQIFVYMLAKIIFPYNDMRDFVLGGDIIKLSETESVPQYFNHIIYTDIFFISLKSAEYLLQNIFLFCQELLCRTESILILDKSGELKKNWNRKKKRRMGYLEMMRIFEFLNRKINKSVTFFLNFSWKVGSEPIYLS